MKVAVLVSGGVDSSVALNLLKNQGHEVTAFYIKIWLEDELSYLGNCPWQEDLDYAQKVCDKLNVPLQVVSLQKEYWDNVVNYTIAEIKAGRTPNPDLMCNQYIKFGTFLDKIDASFDKVASGHYAKVVEEGGKFKLFRNPDLVKDQTYFLARLTQKQLSRALFPLGEYTKPEIRDLASQFDLPTKNRKDSQGICFLGKLKFRDFVQHHLGQQEGDIVEVETGSVLGRHQGFWFYTLGQRQGLGLAGGPWYVVNKDAQNNIVYISKNYFSADKPRDSFFVENFNWFNGKPEFLRSYGFGMLTTSAHPELVEGCKANNSFIDLQVKIRHGEKLYDCNLNFVGPDKADVQLQERDQGIAPGQFAVFYNDQECLGSAVIV